MEKVSIMINGILYEDDDVISMVSGWENGIFQMQIELKDNQEHVQQSTVEPEREIQDITNVPSTEQYSNTPISGNFRLEDSAHDRLEALSNLRGNVATAETKGEKETFDLMSGNYDINDIEVIEHAVDDIVAHEHKLFEQGYLFFKETKYPTIIVGENEELYIQEQIVVIKTK